VRWLGIGLMLLALLGCGAARGRDYVVRGRVAELPDPHDPASGFQVSHEAVDDFVGRDGQRTGMDPMTMGFPLAPGVSLKGLLVGDPIRFVLHIDWSAEPTVRITRIRKLPPGTPIVFRAAEPGRERPKR